VRIWWVRSTIVINLIFLLAALAPVETLAGGAVGRLLTSAGALASGPVPASFTVVAACRDDALCAARLVARSLGPRARLERVRHPDTDSIRRVKSAPSLAGWNIICGNTLRLDLVRFGRKAIFEIEQAVSQAGARTGGDIRALEIDLRRNRGGNLDRMLKVAALFLGQMPDAVRLSRGAEIVRLDIAPAARRISFARLTLHIGPDTASSAEIFTALMRAHGEARVRGRKSYGKDYLLRVVPVNHDWQLLVPAETVTVPGASLSGGIRPDVPTGENMTDEASCRSEKTKSAEKPYRPGGKP